ncbi:MAG: glycosyltransferase family 4 protein [Thermoplasmatales archaeon]|nr:glycosyltransferase family 4 protein [Thermoplasmatales archaeon]
MARKYNICILTRAIPAHGTGGMEGHTLLLCKGIVKKGHNVSVITTGHPKGDERENIEGVDIYYLKHTKPRIYSKKWWFESVKKFETLHKQERFDIVHSQSAGGYYLIKKGLNKKYNLPFVATLHGTFLNEAKTKTLQFSFRHPINSGLSLLDIFKDLYKYIIWERAYLPSSDAIITVSQKLIPHLKNYYPIDSRKVFPILNGIDTNKFSPSMDGDDVRMKYGVNTKKMILCVGRVEREKGFQNVIYSLPKILRGANAVLLIVGVGPYMDSLKVQVKNLGIDGNVIFTGEVLDNDLPKYYSASDVFVAPSIRVEGLPLVVLEAMASGKTVIASNIGGIPDVIENWKDGILVPAGDTKALTESVMKVLMEKEISNKIKKNARRKILEKFSVEKMVDETINVYKSLIDIK